MSTISFIVPTIGRPSLQATVASVERWDGDELLVIKHDPPGGNWGNAERQHGLDIATKQYIAFIDDDDVYVPGHRQIMADAIQENPGKPILFRVLYPNGSVIWKPSNIHGRPPQIKNGNVSSQMILVPNNRDMLAKWDQGHSFADFLFVARSKWGNRSAWVWREEVIALMGHDTSTGHGTKNIHAPACVAAALGAMLLLGCAARMHTSPATHPNEMHVILETQRFAALLGVVVDGVITTKPYMVPAAKPLYAGEKVPAAGRYVGGRIEYYRPVIQGRSQEYGTALAAHEVAHVLFHGEADADACANLLLSGQSCR